MESGKDLMRQFAKEIEEELKGQVTVDVIIRTGNPLYEIANFCNRTKPYAVVIGTRENGGFTRFLLGSTTLGLIRECYCPVMIIPNDFAFHIPAKIGLASDLHDVRKNTPAGQICTVVEDLGGQLEILHVASNDVEEEAEVLAETEQLNTMFATQHPKIRILKSAFTEETLLNYAAEKQLDLLIIVPKKHTWIDTLVRHQHTKHIALHAPVPVMVIKPAP